MRRREFFTLLGGAAAWPLSASAQQPAGMRRIAVLMGYGEADPDAQSSAFLDELTKLGWTEGVNLRAELRWAGGDLEDAKKFAKELVDLEPEVIVGQDTPVTELLKRQTRIIPIVFPVCADPIGAGFVTDLVRPNGNITGFMSNDAELGGKWVELLREIAPHVKHTQVMFNPATASRFLRSYMDPIEHAASHFGVEVAAGEVSNRNSIESVVAQGARDHFGGLIVLPDQFNTRNRELIIALTSKYRLPAIYYNRLFTKAGGLIAYGINFAESYRQAAGYVDRLLRGAKVAELPVQRPTKYELTINLKTAQALGVKVPVLLQQLADEVIE